MKRLNQIREQSSGLTDLCAEHLRQSIRHVQRNCNIDCNTHDDELSEFDCKQPERHDGDRMAAALAAIPALLSAVEGVLAHGADREKYTDTGDPKVDMAIRSYAYHVRRIITTALEGK